MPKTIDAPEDQPSDDSQPRAEQRRDHALADGAGHRDASHRQQLLDMELQADAEHQQDHADLGELFGHSRIHRHPGRVRADERAGQQIADNRRKSQPLRDVAEEERAAQARRERKDEVVLVHVLASLTDR